MVPNSTFLSKNTLKHNQVIPSHPSCFALLQNTCRLAQFSKKSDHVLNALCKQHTNAKMSIHACISSCPGQVFILSATSWIL